MEMGSLTTGTTGMGSLTTFVGLLVALSVASERLVEIIKGFVPFLDKERSDATQESHRRAYIQILAVLSGIGTTYLSMPVLKTALADQLAQLPGGVAIIALGLLASGGSGFWNSILGYVTNLKDLAKLDKVEKQRTLPPPKPR